MIETLDVVLKVAWRVFFILVASGLCVLAILFIVALVRWLWEEMFD